MLLEMSHITKKYGTFTANEDIHFSLKKGEVHAIVGENGAGKTTLMKMLYGMEQPTEGVIKINGQEVNFSSPADAIQHGIGMVHQHFMLFSSFTAAENIVISHEPSKRGIQFDRKKAENDVQKLAQKYRLPINPRQKVAHCPVGIQQRIEILKVLYYGAEIIILDEPTAVLTPLEVKELLETIKNLREQGKSVILITHKLHEVMAVADRITVLRHGQITGVVDKENTSVEELSSLMVGRKLKDLEPHQQEQGEQILGVSQLQVNRLHGKPILEDINFNVYRGEIVGVAGVTGNGQSELIQVLSGLMKIDQGEIRLLDKDVHNQSVATVREAGLAHIPEDRYLWGSAKQATVLEIGMMYHHKQEKYKSKSFLTYNKLTQLIKGWIEDFSIKARSTQQKGEELSGGNLQKLIVARELALETPFIIAAEPTRGVDIGAMEFIHQKLLDKRKQGGAVLLVSSDLQEILTLSDRIIVMFEGKIAGEVPREQATEEKISLLMAGGNVHEHH